MGTQKQKVKVRLDSEQDGVRTTHFYNGIRTLARRSVFLQYTDEDNGHTLQTTVRWDAHELKLMRRGGVSSEQLFIPGVRAPGWYALEGQRFNLQAVTEQLTFAAPDGTAATVDALPVVVDWQYTLWMEEEQIGRFQLRLHLEI